MPRFGQDGMTVLNVAEKNDAAKGLSQILSRGQSVRREGFSKFNKIYEFDCDILNCNCKMIMTSVSGHLMDMDFGGAYRSWNSIAPLALFEAPIRRFVPDQYQDIKRTLEREVRKCQALVIWTDCDREGENIGFEIIEVCKAAKPNIALYRARFSEITARSIHQACQNLVRPDENQSDAVEVRRELDLRIGAAFTRFQTLRLKKRFPDVLSDQLISYGSCQFPTLGFVVERYKQVQEFVPESFWKIRVSHTVDGCTCEFSWKRGRLFAERICAIICSICQENPTARVVNVHSRPKSKWRPVALDTVELEKLASRKLRINAKETMRIAEKLYTQGVISYPRTETNIFPKSMDLVALVEQQVSDPQWGAFASRILENGGPNPRNGKKTDNAHPPIHPAKSTNALQGNEKRIYEFVVRHFLACVSQDAQGHETTVEVELAGEKFSAQGLMVLALNYLEVYPYERWNGKTIPIYNQGQTFRPDVIEMVAGETRPPKLLTEADLIALMERHGIGTDATHAEHIETIKNRHYVGVQADNTFLPGQLGMGLVEGYDKMGFAMSKPHLRAALEADLKSICDGTKRKEDVLQQQIRSYREVFIQATQQVEKLDLALAQYFGNPRHVPDEVVSEEVSEPVRKCPKCAANPMVIRKTKEGNWMLGCMGFPDCRNSLFFPKFVLAASKSAETCATCLPQPVFKIDFTFKKGSVPPMIPLRYTGCVGGCDEFLSGVLDVNERRGPPPGGGGATSVASQRKTETVPSRGDVSRSAPLGNVSGRPELGRAPRVSEIGGRGRAALAGAAVGVGRAGNLGSDRSRATLGRGRALNAGPKRRLSPSSERSGEENVVSCNCGQPAVQLTTRKEGPNLGRPFYKCASLNSACNFFLWADGSGPERSSMGGFEGSSLLRSSSSNARNFDPSAEAIDRQTQSVTCLCSQPSPMRTVQKDGPNKGRNFYGCGGSGSQKCNFFQWADESQAASRESTAGGYQGADRTPGLSATQMCSCSKPAVTRTVQKDGPNKGRQFFTCPAPRDQGCGFFQWVDEESASSAAVPGRDSFSAQGWRGRGRGRGIATGSRGRTTTGSRGAAGKHDAGRKRKCGECNQEGHTKRTCPLSR